MEKDYYKILGVSVSSNDDEIKQEFKKKALIFHPDKNKSPGAEEKFIDIALGYNILMDRNARKEYDMKWNYRKPFSKSNNNSRNGQKSNTTFNNNNNKSRDPMKSHTRGRKRTHEESSTGSKDDADETAKHFNSKRFNKAQTNFNFFKFHADPENTSSTTSSFYPPSESHNNSNNNNPKAQFSFRPKYFQFTRNAPIEHDIFVTPEEFAASCTKKLTVTRKVTELDGIVRTENKVLSILVGPWMGSGSKVRFNQEGDIDKRNPFQLPSDVLVTIRVKSESIPSSNTTDTKSPPSSSSLPSASSINVFRGLNLRQELTKGVEDLGYCSSSFVQKKALHNLVNNSGPNLISLSPARRGKIVAYSLALLNRIDPNINAVQVVIIVPSNDNGIHIGSIIQEVGKLCEGVSVTVALHGLKVTDDTRSHIVIATAAQIYGWACNRVPTVLSELKMLVVDGADTIMTNGHSVFCTEIARKLPVTSRRLIFSAVYNHETMNFAENIAGPGATIIHQK